MKKQYTEMITSLRHARRVSGKSVDELIEIARRRIPTMGYANGEYNIRMASLSMEVAYEQTGAARHIFMPNRGFCEWLAECAQTLEPELGEKAAEGFGTPFVCLHFPCESKLPSALVGIGTGEQMGVILLEFSMAAGMGGCCVRTHLAGQRASVGMSSHHLNAENTSAVIRQEQGELGEFYTKMIAGLGLYMSCFPEQVVDGIPADAKRAEYAAGNARTIGVSGAVIHHGSGVSAHYRTGHFRLLSADRYVNKRGQIVFVHGCFVNGQAKTVLAPETEGGIE